MQNEPPIAPIGRAVEPDIFTGYSEIRHLRRAEERRNFGLGRRCLVWRAYRSGRHRQRDPTAPR